MKRKLISLLAKLCIVAIAMVASAGSALAESSMLLPYPDSFGEIPAGTYDQDGQRVGSARLSISLTADQTVRIEVESGVHGGARTNAFAELSKVVTKAHGTLLRLKREQSESHDESGKSLGIMRIDHEKGEASCSPPEGDESRTVHFALPEEDRVSNVPLNLLFLPLVQGRVEQVEFQLFLCRGGPRVIEFSASIANGKRPAPDQNFRIVEIQYRPDLGPLLSWIASSMLPNLSFWFDANGSGTYLAHRMPLFSSGPKVTIVRDGLSPSILETSQ